jgi:hypothetical protein
MEIIGVFFIERAAACWLAGRFSRILPGARKPHPSQTAAEILL